ncbi:hypothetical protein ACOJVP_03815, partial [Mycobacterium sp. THU-M116]
MAGRESTSGGRPTPQPTLQPTPQPTPQPTLWAVSDLHTGHLGNKPIAESLHPSSPED